MLSSSFICTLHAVRNTPLIPVFHQVLLHLNPHQGLPLIHQYRKELKLLVGSVIPYSLPKGIYHGGY